MDNTILPSNEVKEFEERLYLNPNLQVEETTSFIDNLRNTQKANNQEIAQQTQALGTNVPSNLGGLTGAGSYFTSRYQTPQTNTVAQNLRAAAQADALNKALSNEQAMWKKRYNDAYRNYQKRAWDNQNATTGGGSGDQNTEGRYEKEDPYEATIGGVIPGVASGYTVGNFDTETGDVLGYTGVPYGEEGKTNYTYYLNSYDPAGASIVKRARKEGDMTESGTRSGTIRVWKLPNGTTTNVDATYYTVVKDREGNYYAKNRSTGALTPIGS